MSPPFSSPTEIPARSASEAALRPARPFPQLAGPPIVGILSTDEMYFEHGGWVPRRRLNGDENSQGNELKLFARDLDQGRIYRVRLYRYR